MTVDRPVLREYLRVSQDESGRERSPNEQHNDHIRDGQAHGFGLHPDPYRDIGSASRHSAKARADFDRMMADLEAGEFGADGLAIWEPSRGSRQVWEWARLIDLLAQRKLTVWVHTGTEGGRFYDLNHPRDRKALHDDAVDAEYESGKTSLRSLRNHAKRAADGSPAGRLSMGQVAEYDPRTGRLQRRVWDPEVSKLPVELFARFARGEPLLAVSRDWAKRGVVNGAGKPYTDQQLRQVLRNRAYIGQRVHIIGQPGKRWWEVPPSQVSITRAQWEPLLKTEDGKPDIDLFETVQQRLDGDGEAPTRPAAARHLLTVIGKCDPCGGPLTARKIRGEFALRCRERNCVQVPEAELDALVRAAMQAFLANPDQYQQLDHGENTAAELRAARAERDRIQRHYDEMQVEHEELRMSPAAFARAEPKVLAKLDSAKREVRRLEMPPRLAGLITPGPDVAERWPTDIVIERKIAAEVLRPDAVGELRIVRTPRHGKTRAPIEERVVFVRG